MRKALIISTLIFLSISSFAQDRLSWWQWSDENVFSLQKQPIIQRFGPESDSLKNTFGVDFYELDGTYYSVANWADYYYWYVNAYWFLFNNPELYIHAYLSDNDLLMVSYVAGNNYLSNFYPSSFILNEDRQIGTNYLSSYRRFDKERFNSEVAMLQNEAAKKNRTFVATTKRGVSAQAAQQNDEVMNNLTGSSNNRRKGNANTSGNSISSSPSFRSEKSGTSSNSGSSSVRN